MLALMFALALVVVAVLFLSVGRSTTTVTVSVPPGPPPSSGTRPGPLTGQVAAASVEDALASARAVLARMPADSPAAKWITVLNDNAQPVKARRQAARALGELGSDEAVAALKLAYYHGPAAVKLIAVECLGMSNHPEARGLLLQVLDSGEEEPVLAAIRGFGLRGDVEAADILGNILTSSQRSEDERLEAAAALGDVAQPAAVAALTRAAADLQNPEIAEKALDGLGHRSFADTGAFFREYLDNKNVPADLKVSALEALGNAQGDPSPLLLEFLKDPNTELRAAAAWALMTADTEANLGPRLIDALNQESDAQVRARLFHALAAQDDLPASAVLGLAKKETDPETRLAALDVLVTAFHADENPELLNYFNVSAVPQLKQVALNGASGSPGVEDTAVSAVITLSRAGTPEAIRALEEIAGQAKNAKVAEAAKVALKK